MSARKGAPGVQQEEQAMNSMARRMFELVEPIGVIPYSADEPNEAMFTPGFTNYWEHPLRRTGGALGARRGGGSGRAVLQLRSRRGGSPHSEGVAHHRLKRRSPLVRRAV